MTQEFKDKDALGQAVTELQHDMGEVIHNMETSDVKNKDEVQRLYDKIGTININITDIKDDINKRQKELEEKISKLESDIDEELESNRNKIADVQKDISDSNKQILFIAVTAILSYLFTHFA